MWSGPRNISTAMMYSFASRADCAVTDEPFYGAFLKNSGAKHPMAEKIIADMDCNWRSVTQAMCGDIPGNKSIWYQKHMPHHMIGDVSIMDFLDHVNAFLVRDPALVAASYLAKNELMAAEQLGFAQLVNYHKRISDHLGRAAPVIDSNAILADPEGQLSLLCAALGVIWDPSMLAWQKGPKPYDGIWAKHWYGGVWQSTGFGQPSAFSELPNEVGRIADSCRSDYEYLLQFRI
ncbi:MAG: HAD family hydrolase [Sphingomonadales bacterium]|nr:HAD family hydrolase [Sphingomonadales bacterium]